MVSTQVKKRKRPGAPKGNQNARKHGLFAGYLPEASELDEMAPEEGLKHDLLLLQGRLLNALREYENAVKKNDPVRGVQWDKSVLLHLETITNLRLRMIERGQMREEVWESLEEAVRSANSRQKVRW